MIQFLLIVNKSGQTRFSKYYTFENAKERSTLEGEVTRICLGRRDEECSVFEHRGYRVIYRHFGRLIFLIGTTMEADENILSLYEFMNLFVGSLELYFTRLTELDIMLNLEKVHYILDEMIMNGTVYETNKDHITKQLSLMKIQPLKQLEK
ncbi:hypothetical protein WA158_003863 [Blastocystis sp. Blastoise]